jgi:hypothetical protein
VWCWKTAHTPSTPTPPVSALMISSARKGCSARKGSVSSLPSASPSNIDPCLSITHLLSLSIPTLTILKNSVPCTITYVLWLYVLVLNINHFLFLRICSAICLKSPPMTLTKASNSSCVILLTLPIYSERINL